MAKTFLYRFFGIGKLPQTLVDEFAREGILFIDEGVRGTITYKNFRGGGRVSNWKRRWFGGAIILTKKRIIGYHIRNRIMDVPLDDPRLKKMEFALEEPETLAVAFDADLFQPDWKGRIEYRFRTSFANQILQYVTNLAV